MHIAVHNLRHYLLELLHANAIDSIDVHTELDGMAADFDELFDRMHDHAPEPPATDAERKLQNIDWILTTVPVPVGSPVDGVRWLVKKHKEHKAAWRKHEVELIDQANKNHFKLRDLEDLLLIGPHDDADVKARIHELLATERTVRKQGNMMAEGHEILTAAGIPSKPGYLVDRIRTLVRARGLERRRARNKDALIKEIHSICDAAGVSPHSAPARVQDLVHKVERLREHTSRLGEEQDKLIDIARMAFDAGVTEPNMPADQRVRRLIDKAHEILNGAWACPAVCSVPLLVRVQYLVKKHLRLKAERPHGVASDLLSLDTIADAIEALDETYDDGGDWWTTKVLKDAASIVRNWGRT